MVYSLEKPVYIITLLALRSFRILSVLAGDQGSYNIGKGGGLRDIFVLLGLQVGSEMVDGLFVRRFDGSARSRFQCQYMLHLCETISSLFIDVVRMSRTETGRTVG